MDFLRFCTAIRAYCAAPGGSVTSWGRTPAHNRKVGGIAKSLHVAWKATDIVYDDPAPPLELRQTVARNQGLYVHAEGDHDHLRPLDELST